MRNVVLRAGSSGPFVRDLQLALNNRLNPSPNLIVNGLITTQTQAAIRLFQRANWLEEDGIAGPCTLDAVYDTEAMRPVLLNVDYVATQTPEMAWAATIAMLKDVGIATVQFTTPQALIDKSGGLITKNADNALIDGHQAIARAFGLKYFRQQVWPVATLIGLLQNGPVAVVLKSQTGGAVRGNRDHFRYLVIVGARGSHTPDGSSTTLRVYDAAPNRNNTGIYSTTFTTMLREHLATPFGMLTV